MPHQFSFDVFLSHSVKDREIVRPIAERLREDGLRVWFDEWQIQASDDRNAKIGEGLEQSCALVLCMSTNAFGPEWIQLKAGTLPFRDPLNMVRRFIPLRLDEAPVRDSMHQFLCINWALSDNYQQYVRLLESCRSSAKARAEPREGNKSNTGNAENIINLGLSEVYHYEFNSNGKRVLTTCFDNNDIEVWNLESGDREQTLVGHKANVTRVDLSPDEAFALSASYDKTLRLWNMASGRCVRVLKGHSDNVYDAKQSPDGRKALSGGHDNSVRLWDLTSGECVSVLGGHSGGIYRVAWSADQRYGISSADDNTVRLWDIDRRECLHVFEGHTETVFSSILSADCRRLLTASGDKTMRLWDVETARCLRVFEGHTDRILRLAWAFNAGYALSGADDRTVRVWDLEKGQCLRVLEGHQSIITGLGVSADGTRAFSGDAEGSIRVWNLAEFLTGARILLASTLNQVQYKNAKVLLVGDTGVGKSGLAERLVHNRFVPTESTHARKAHVFDSKIVKEPSGVAVHQETVLWDLAGQPAYRSVHQLSMDDAALACVLFDARSETNPFEAAAYWAQVLDQARMNTKLKKLLVASRVDVGGLPTSKERIENFAQQNGFAQFIPTSARTGEGCPELFEAIRKEISWADLPKLTTTETLAAMRDYIARLKGENRGDEEELQREPVRMANIGALHEGFASYSGQKIPSDEFVAHLQRLEASDSLTLLVFQTTGAVPRAEDLVLLDPTRVDAYSSAILIAAKDEPDGPGHLLESRVRDGKFGLATSERIPDPESERHLLWYVMEKLLARDLALRERIKGEDYVVFPSQCTAELRFPGAAAFGVTIGFSGPIRSIYARLIAHLAHYEGFKKREFFQDAAAYRPEAAGRCLIRLHDLSRGQGELEVLYDVDTPAAIRQGFLEFVGKHLESNSNPGTVTRRHAYHCANEKCRNPFEDRVVKARLEARKKNLLCPICEEKTPLIDLLAAPNAAAESVAAQIVSDARSGRQRMTAALVIKAKEAEGKFDVFLSHNSKDKAVVEKIAKRLKAVGLRAWLDKWNLTPGDTVISVLEKAIQTIPCAALCFGPADVGKWHILEVQAYVSEWANKNARMIPVILPGVEEAPKLPLFVRQTLWVDMRDWENETDDGFYRLVCGVTGRAPGDSPMKRFGVRDVAEWQRMQF